jgi:hypothetical protein
MSTKNGSAPHTRRGPNFWVVHRRGRFSIKEEGSRAYLIPPLPQKIAIVLARLLARANGSELIVQGAHGRICMRDSRGSDRSSPEG